MTPPQLVILTKALRAFRKIKMHMFPRTCAGIATETRVGDIEGDTHEVRIEGGPQENQRKNYKQNVILVGKVLWEVGRRRNPQLFRKKQLWEL